MNHMKLAPRISEKAVGSAERGVYVFDVPMNANKPEIAKAVEEAFKVKVAEVNILIRKGKEKHFRRVLGRESDQKTAMVKLASGQSIKLFEGGK